MVCSCHRYYAIVHPLSAMVIHSKSRTKKLIAVTWLVSLVLASPYLYCHIRCLVHLPVVRRRLQIISSYLYCHSYTFTIHSRYGIASRQICADRFDDLGHFRRGFFLLLFVVVYLVPMILIGVTCVRIAVTLHQPATTTDVNAAPIAQQRERNKRRVMQPQFYFSTSVINLPV